MKSAIMVLVLIVSASALAQEETLLGSTEIEHGGYGAVVVKYTTVNNKAGVLVGARGGWIINHTFSIGLAGYGLANNVRAHTVGLFGQEYVNLGYGGLDLEYVVNSDHLIHFSVHSLFGAGAVGFRHAWEAEDNNWDDMWGGDYDHNWYHQYDTFFVVEPGVNVDMNVTSWFRMSLGASYRYVSGVSSGATTSKDISGPSGMLTFRFGSF